MGTDESKGWMGVPGIRERADRTLAEQMMGLDAALKLVSGKTVLDLGAAECLIGREFALAGAVDVLCIESLATHLAVARRACADCSQMRFEQAYLQDYIVAHEPPEVYDIVLCLGIIHKMENPAELLGWAARSAKDFLLFRAPANAWNGVVTAKHSKVKCHVPTVMELFGFNLERHVAGARGEGVEYWRRGSQP